MDPISALSIATGIITFVDFGSKLVSLYSDIRSAKDGCPTALSTLQTESHELSRTTSDARSNVSALRARYPQRASNFDRLDEECRVAGEKLRELVHDLTAPSDHGIKAFGVRTLVAVRGFSKQREIAELQARLSNIRERAMMGSIMCVWDDIKASGSKLESIDDAVKNVNDSLQGFMNDMGSLENSQLPPGTLAAGLWASISAATRTSSGPNAGHAEESSHLHEYICNRILDGLDSPERALREGQIQEAFPETFQWLLSNNRTDARKATTFKEWLGSDTSETPFWITGIPASGKSTLMKFVCTNLLVRKHLQRWAGELPLLVCSIYLWNPGTSGQKSQEGLMKSLLHQLLSQVRHLCPAIASRRYLYFQLAGRDALSPPDWTERELKDILLRFISQVEDTHRLAIFIDGLDEYEGDLEQLVSFVHQLHQGRKSTKLCVSSRPWNIFRDTFRAYPSLKMELFTKPDIEKYVRTRINDSPAFQLCGKIDPGGVENIKSTIINKANGVFLWVVLVVEQAVTTVRDNSDLGEARKLIETLPLGLEELYKAIRGRLNQSLRLKASKMFQLVFCWAEASRTTDRPFGAVDFWAAINCHDPSALEEYPADENVLETLPALLERDLAGATGGMLQVIVHDSEATVQFLHRTVYDWLQGIRSSIISDGPDGYDPGLVLCSVLVSRLQQIERREKHSLEKIQRLALDVDEAFRMGRYCNGSYQSRQQLALVLEQIPLDRIPSRPWMQPSTLAGIPPRMVRSHSHSDSRYFFAIRNSCAPYIQAGIDNKSFVPWSVPRWAGALDIPPFLRRTRKDYVSMVTRTALDCDDLVGNIRQEVNMRLRTVGTLMQALSLPRSSLMAAVEKKVKDNDWPKEYFQALLSVLKGNALAELPTIAPRPPEDVPMFRRPPQSRMTID